MNDTTRLLSVIAYYLSEYDMDAVRRLGYSTRAEALRELSKVFGRENNYLKLRRDEFDVLTSSHRNGWKNRKAAKDVVEMFEHLSIIPYEQLTNIIMSIIENKTYGLPELLSRKEDITYKPLDSLTEDELEQIINYKDETSRLVIKPTRQNERIYNQDIIRKLKLLYNNRCQICGKEFSSIYGVDYSEAHHIDYFAKSYNNNSSNIIILCPDHHRIIHKLEPIFERESLAWIYPNGRIETLVFNLHL